MVIIWLLYHWQGPVLRSGLIESANEILSPPVPGTGHLTGWDAGHLCVRNRGIMHPLSAADARLATI